MPYEAALFVRFTRHYYNDKIREDRMHRSGIGEMRNAYKLLVRKPEGKRPFGSPRQETNIRMDLREK
jgi:hypothetical protein